jgi:hypothetical protein
VKRCSLVGIFVAPWILIVATGDAQTTTRDSNGVRISETRAGGAPPAFVLSAKPVVDFGGEIGDTLGEIFGTIDAATRLSDGRMIIATSGRQVSFRAFDQTGKYLATLARPGQGPGEIPAGRARLLSLPGDSIAYLTGRRMLVFAPNGMWSSTEVHASIGGSSVLGLLDGHTVLTQISAPDSMTLYHRARRPVGGPQTDTGVLVSAIRRRAAMDAIPITSSIGNATYMVPKPFVVSHQLIPYRDGFAATGGMSFEITVHDSLGRKRRIIRRPVDLAVSARDIAGYRETLLGDIPEPGKPSVERWLAMVSYPTVKAAILALRTDPAGRIWAEEYRTARQGPQRWSAFGADGGFLGVLDVPAGIRVMEIGRDHLLGALRDADGFDHVLLYSLTAPR